MVTRSYLFAESCCPYSSDVDPVRIVPRESGDDVTVSATSYLSFKRCPALANARYQGIYGPDSRPGFTGSLAHRIFSRHLSAGAIAPEDFVQACREEIGGSSLVNKMGGLELKPSVLAGVIEEVRGLYERFTKFPQDGFEGTEVELKLHPASGVELVGTVDAIYKEDLGGHRLVDWKTGELGEVQDQLIFYALLWALDRGEVPAYVEAVSVRTGERFHTVPSTADVASAAADVAEMVDVLRRLWATGGDFERRGGPWCRFCPILEGCREGEATIKILSSGGGPP